MRKSPDKMNVIPPMDLLPLQISCKVRFIAQQIFCAQLVHLYRIIRTQSLKIITLFLLLQCYTGFSLKCKLIVILKHECAVLPPGNRAAAMRDDTTDSAFFPLIPTLFNTIFIRKFLPLNSGATKKKIFPVIMLYVIITFS